VNQLNLQTKEGFPKISRWIFGEAQTGKNMLDCHFSYLNLQFDKFLVGTKGQIQTEDDIFEALIYDGGLNNSTAMKVYCNSENSIMETYYSSGTKVMGIRDVHDLDFQLHAVVNAHLFSNFTHDIEGHTSYPKEDLTITPAKIVTLEYTHSNKLKSTLGLRKKTVKKEQKSVMGYSVEKVVDSVIKLENPIVVSNEIGIYNTINIVKCSLKRGWAILKPKRDQGLQEPVKKVIRELYIAGLVNPQLKCSAERALQKLKTDGHLTHWRSKLIVTSTKIQQYFGQLSRDKLLGKFNHHAKTKPTEKPPGKTNKKKRKGNNADDTFDSDTSDNFPVPAIDEVDTGLVQNKRKQAEQEEIGPVYQLLSPSQLRNQGPKMKTMKAKRATNNNPKFDYLTENEDNYDWEIEDNYECELNDNDIDNPDDGGAELAKDINDILRSTDVDDIQDFFDEGFEDKRSAESAELFEFQQIIDPAQKAAQGKKTRLVAPRQKPKNGFFLESSSSPESSKLKSKKRKVI
jgi:hypothetical protein